MIFMKTTKDEKDKDKVLEQVLMDIEKQFGKGAVMRLGSEEHMEIDTTSSGSLALDIALGVGGYPKGRIIEIYGPESSGKTTFALHAIAEVQKNGGRAAFIDAEHALDPVYAKNLGVNINELLLSQPDTGEQALEICEALVRSEVVNIIVVDSVAALVPRAEIEGDMGDSHVGLQARLMSQALRKLSGAINKTKTTAIFINQLREKVGVMFGNPETTPGGRALKFYSTIRLDVRRGEQIKVGDQILGNRTNIKVVKNKVAPPFKLASVDIMYGTGVSHEGEIIDIASDLNIIDKSGAWYSYQGQKIGQGKENVKLMLKQNPDMKKPINQWLAFLDMERGDLLEMAEKENEEIKEAVTTYEVLTGDKAVKRLAEIRMLSNLEEKSALAAERERGTEEGLKQGKKEGMKEGKKEGLKEGEKNKQLEIAQKLLKIKMPIEQIIEVTGLTEEEIKKIKI